MPSFPADLQAICVKLLAHVPILPRRLLLETPGVQATTAILRSVWGDALHQTDLAAYNGVFSRQQESSARERTAQPEHGLHAANRPQGYVLSQAASAGPDLFVLDALWIGSAVEHDRALTQAWTLAGKMGLGPRRRPFFVRGNFPLQPDGTAAPTGPVAPWALDRVCWPLPGAPESTPCRLRFEVPLRLLREEHAVESAGPRRLIEQPTLSNLVAAALRRIEPFLSQALRADLQQVRPLLLALADSQPAGRWEQRQHTSLTRWSSRQQNELEFRGVTGQLDLPHGPGPMWPLLAAASWLHVGKNTTHGLGQLRIELIGPATNQ